MPLKDLDKLTVVKLRAELIARGLDSKGNKPFLVDRLRIALEQEERDGTAPPDLKMFATDNNQLEDASNDQDTGNEMEDQVASEAADQSISFNPGEISKGSNGTSASEAGVLNNGSHLPSKEAIDPPVQILTGPAAVTHVVTHGLQPASAIEKPLLEKPQLPLLNQSSADERIAAECPETDVSSNSAPNDSIMAVYGGKDETFTEDSVLEQSTDFTSSIQADDTSASNTTLNCSQLETKKVEEETEAIMVVDTAGEPASSSQGDVLDKGAGSDEKMDDESTAAAPEGDKADVAVVQDAETAQETKSPKRKADERNDRGSKRHRDRSSSPSTVNKSEDGPPPEDEPEWDASLILLDWYNSDLNLTISKTDFLTASPLIDGGFAYMWAGARGTYGFHKGKVCFEVKILENLTVAHLEESEPNHHLLRAGWSIDSPTFQLGEEPMSYGYGGTGKISQNSEFKDYGVPFQLNDVVGVYLDASEDKETVDLLFTVNGETQGVAFSLTKEELDGRALFPHVLTKNCRFEVNFGQKEEPWFQPMEGFEWAGKVPIESRVRGPVAPATRAECQMIMMCGLPGSGKTTWANKFTKENADRKFNVIGTNAFLEKMKVNGLARRKNYSGRWEALIEKCTRCLNILLDVAAKRRRNYILDQTNVYPTAQKRKMSYFSGFQRKAVVIVPTDEEFKVRAEKRIQEEGKDVPDSAVMEMKANFKIPSVDETFTEVDFPELDREEALKVTEKYSTEAKAAGFGQPSPKRQRQNYGNRSKNDRNDSRRHSGGRDRNRDSRGSNSHRSQNSSSSRSSYRDSRDDRHRPPPPPHWRGGGGGPGRGGSWSNRGPPPPPMHRNGPYSPRRGPPLPPGPMVNRGGGGWSAPPLDRPYPGGGRSGGGGGRNYDDRRNDRAPYPPAPRRDGGGPSPWMNSPSMASSGPQRSSGWASQPWNSSGGGGGGGGSGSSSSPYGQSQQSSYASASYGGSALYGSAPGGSSRPVASGGGSYGSLSSAARPLGAGASYGSSVSGASRPVANYGGAGITGLARPTNYGSNGPTRPANNYGTPSQLPGSRPSNYGNSASAGARPAATSYPTGSINSWSQQQQQQQPPSGYQYASYTTNQSTYSGGK